MRRRHCVCYHLRLRWHDNADAFVTRDANDGLSGIAAAVAYADAIKEARMSDYIFYLRIGKLHIQVTYQKRLRLSINPRHRWLMWPLVQFY